MTTFQQIEQRHTRALTSATSSERAAAVTAAQTEITDAATAEVTRLEQQIVATREAARVAAEHVAARAEATRRERAAALAKRAFDAGKDGILGIIHAFRIEPTRAGAVAGREVWDRLNAIAIAELGEELSPHVLGAVIIADVLADSANVNATSAFGVGYHDAGATLEALHAFVRATTPAELQESLAAADLAITKTAARARNDAPPTAHARELVELRRAHLTHRDLMSAQQEVEKRHAAEQQAEFERTFVPVPTRDEFFRQQLERMRDAAGRVFGGAS